MYKPISIIFFKSICILSVLTINDENVQIIEDSPPVIIPLNDSFVHVDYEKSVNISDFSKIYTLQLVGRNQIALAIATRFEYSSFFESYNKQKLQDGYLLAKIDPCRQYDKLKLIFWIDGSLNPTRYDFDYNPTSIILNNFNTWICAENTTTVKLSIKDSEIYQVRSCIQNVFFKDDQANIRYLKDGYNKVKNLTNSRIGFRINYITYESEKVDLISCSVHVGRSAQIEENKDVKRLSQMNTDFDLDNQDPIYTIIGSSASGFLVIICLAIIIIVYVKRRKETLPINTDVNPTYGLDDYYIETKITDENEDYGNCDNDYNESEIRNLNEMYKIK